MSFVASHEEEDEKKRRVLCSTLAHWLYVELTGI